MSNGLTYFCSHQVWTPPEFWLPKRREKSSMTRRWVNLNQLLYLINAPFTWPVRPVLIYISNIYISNILVYFFCQVCRTQIRFVRHMRQIMMLTKRTADILAVEVLTASLTYCIAKPIVVKLAKPIVLLNLLILKCSTTKPEPKEITH